MSTLQYDEAGLTCRAKMAYVYLKAALKTLDGEPLPQDIYAFSDETELFWEDPDTKAHALQALLTKDKELASLLQAHALLQPQ